MNIYPSVKNILQQFKYTTSEGVFATNTNHYLQQIRIMRVKGRKRRWVHIKRKRWVHIKDGYYAITKILERKRTRDGSIICKVEWVGSLTTDWVSEDALCRKSCKLLFCFICFNTCRFYSS